MEAVLLPSLLIWKFMLHFSIGHIANVLHEVRIYENAPIGTKATLNEAFDIEMKRLKNCFAQLDADFDWSDLIDFDSAKMIFFVTGPIPSDINPIHSAILHSMCPGNAMRSIHFSVHITRKNRYPPKFASDRFQFFVPAGLKPGSELARIQAVDNDPIIYNSQLLLSIAENDSKSVHWKIHRNGSIELLKALTNLQLYRSYSFRVLAVDFGSPQLYSSVNVSIIPVSISQPKDVRVNIATPEYQVFEWNTPEYGIPKSLRLILSQGKTIIHEQEHGSAERIGMTKLRLLSGVNYTISVIAIDEYGETPSQTYAFSPDLKNPLSCNGDCYLNAGVPSGIPMCIHSSADNGNMEQFRDSLGQAYCLCFEGYSGPQCEISEYCQTELQAESYGTLEWPQVSVNKSVNLPCPFNSEKEMLEKKCTWNREKSMAVWNNTLNEDRCKRQSSILVHLGVLANYAQRSDQSASGIHAVLRFLDAILQFPAFERHNKNVRFDTKIAEHVVQLMDTLANYNMFSITNSTQIQHRLVNYIKRFARRIPIPYSVASPKGGLQLKSWNVLDDQEEEQDEVLMPAKLRWNPRGSAATAELYSIEHDPTAISLAENCFLRISSKLAPAVFRAACLRNSTLLPNLTGYSPLLLIETEKAESIAPKINVESILQRNLVAVDNNVQSLSSAGGYHQNHPFWHLYHLDSKQQKNILIGFRPTMVHFLPTSFNYTCASFDHKANRWSTDGIIVLYRDTYSGMLLCGTDHFGTFALIPEWVFKSEIAIIESLLLIFPFGTAIMTVASAFLSLLILCCQSKKSPDLAIKFLLFSIMILHLDYLAMLDHIFSDVFRTISVQIKFPANLNRIIYPIINFSILSIGASIAIINASIHSKIVQIECGTTKIPSKYSRSLTVLFFSGVVPLSMAIFVEAFNGNIFLMLAEGKFVHQEVTWPVIASFVFIFVLITGCAFGFGIYSQFYGRILLSANDYQSENIHQRKRFLRELTTANSISLVLLLSIYLSALFFFYTSEIIRNISISALHLITTVSLTILAALLIKIQRRMSNSRESIPNELTCNSNGHFDGYEKTTNKAGFRNFISLRNIRGSEKGDCRQERFLMIPDSSESSKSRASENAESPDNQFLVDQLLIAQNNNIPWHNYEVNNIRQTEDNFYKTSNQYFGHLHAFEQTLRPLIRDSPLNSRSPNQVGIKTQLSFQASKPCTSSQTTLRTFQPATRTICPPIAHFAYPGSDVNNGEVENIEDFTDIQSISISQYDHTSTVNTTQNKSPKSCSRPLISAV